MTVRPCLTLYDGEPTGVRHSIKAIALSEWSILRIGQLWITFSLFLKACLGTHLFKWKWYAIQIKQSFKGKRWQCSRWHPDIFPLWRFFKVLQGDGGWAHSKTVFVFPLQSSCHTCRVAAIFDHQSSIHPPLVLWMVSYSSLIFRHCILICISIYVCILLT